MLTAPNDALPKGVASFDISCTSRNPFLDQKENVTNHNRCTSGDAVRQHCSPIDRVDITYLRSRHADCGVLCLILV